jgi:hypothetical protein
VSVPEVGRLCIEEPRMTLLARPLVTLYWNCRFFSQNTTLLFNKSAKYFDYCFIAKKREFFFSETEIELTLDSSSGEHST